MDKKTVKVTKQLSSRQGSSRKIESKSINPDNIADLLFDTIGIEFQPDVFSHTHCQDMIKGLVYFVAYHPPSLTKNLFKEDQGSGVNSFDPLSIKGMRGRNWQYVYAFINRHLKKEKPDWIFKNELLLLVYQKSNASMTASLMAEHNAGGLPYNLATSVIAYWLGKLYSVSIYRAQPADLPEPLRQAYSLFIKWKGPKWESKVTSLPFRNEDMYEGEELRTLFPFAHEYIFNEPATLNERAKYSVDLLEVHLKSMCTELGEDQLVNYLSHYPWPFPNFYLDTLKMKLEKLSKSSKEDLARLGFEFFGFEGTNFP